MKYLLLHLDVYFLQLELYSLPLKVPLLHLEIKGIKFSFQFEKFSEGREGRLWVVFGGCVWAYLWNVIGMCLGTWGVNTRARWNLP